MGGIFVSFFRSRVPFHSVWLIVEGREGVCLTEEGWWESSANKGKSYSRERARRRLKLLRFRVEIQRVAKSWLQTWRSGTWARQAVQRGRGEVCARERKRKKEEGGKEEGRPTTTKFARSTKVPWRLARKVRGPGIRSVATKNKINGSLSRTQAGCKLQEDRPLPWKNAATLRAPSILAHLVYIALWPGDIRLNYNARRSLHSRNDASTPPFSFFKFLADHPFSFARSISSILAPLPSFTVSLTVPNLILGHDP